MGRDPSGDGEPMNARNEFDVHPPFDIVDKDPPIVGVDRVAGATLPTRYGTFRIVIFQAADTEITGLFLGEETHVIPLVRLHSECLTGDTFGSLRCDCGEQLEAALAHIARAECGVLLYLRQEGRGIGLANKIRAYALQDAGMDTVDANVALGLPIDGRDYRPAASVLRSLHMSRIRLLTNNPSKHRALERCGIHVVERVPLVTVPNASNLSYLHAKEHRMGHLLNLDDPDTATGAS